MSWPGVTKFAGNLLAFRAGDEVADSSFSARTPRRVVGRTVVGLSLHLSVIQFTQTTAYHSFCVPV